MQSNDSIAGLMRRFRTGDREAADRLIELGYAELRRIAAAQIRKERPSGTWHTTVLVNELFLELRRIRQLQSRQDSSDDEERGAFFSLAATIMRRLLRSHMQLRRDRERSSGEAPIPAEADCEQALNELEHALHRLALIDERLRLVVEWKVYCGLTTGEISERLGKSERTVERYWSFARNWLTENYFGE